MLKKLALSLIGLALLFTSAMAQNRSVKGKVLDENGAGIPGAGVLVVGNGKVGTVTDLDGNFSLTNIPSSAKELEISFLGYETRTVAISANVVVKLQPDSEILETAVVTGMTNIDKRLFTGASNRLEASEVMLSGVSDISRSLEGRSAGVSVQNVSGTFGTAPKIRVRGATSILGSSKPLWVVDGVIIEDVTEVSADELSSGDATTLISSAIAGLNQDDIESINILKDGSATSIYGAKAMAGVIVVTTKKGKSGTSKFTYTGEFTTRFKPSYSQYNIMNSQDHMSVLKELEQKGFFNLASTIRASEYGIYGKMYSLINTYDPVTGTFALDNTEAAKNAYLREAEYRNTDWFNLLFSNAVQMNHSVSMSTGGPRSNSYMSLSVMTDPGWYKMSSVDRYTFNANTTFKILDNLSFNILGNASYRKQMAPGTLSQEADGVYGEISRSFDINPFSYAMNTSRTIDPNETYVRNYTGFNIFQELDNNYIETNVTDVRVQGELKWSIIPGLDLAALGSYRYNSSSMQHFIKDDSNQARAYREMSDDVIRNNNPYLYTDPDQLNSLPISILPNGGIYEKREYRSSSYTIRTSLTWNKEWNRTHILNLFGGNEITSVDRSNDWFRGWGMQYSQGEKAFYNYLAFKQSTEQNADYYTLNNTTRRSVAFFAMANYSYKSRYSLNGTIRYEGTNRLGKDRSARWLPTWNVGAAWNVHNEEWFKSALNVVSNLTFKASYSLTADAGPDYISNSSVIIKSFNTAFRPTASDKETGLQIYRLGNSALTYEKKHELNVGAAIGLFGNRVNLEIDFYTRNNFDLLGRTNTQGTGGEIWKYANIADMKSRGVEFTLSTKNVQTKDFKWTSDFTFSWAEQRITNLHTDANMLNLVRGTGYNLEGYAPYSIFSIQFAGLDSEGFPTFHYGTDDPSTPEREDLITKDNYSDINFQDTDEANLKSLVYAGPTDPIYTGGFGNTLTWKNFRLNIFMTYGFGNVVRMNQVFKSSYSDYYALPNEFQNRWTVSGDEKQTDVPVIASKRQLTEYNSSYVRRGLNAYNYSTARIAHGDFIRMKEISLTYDFPKRWFDKSRVSNMSVKGQVTNPFLVYAHKSLNGQDPEYAQSGGVSSPIARQFTFTFKIGF